MRAAPWPTAPTASAWSRPRRSRSPAPADACAHRNAGSSAGHDALTRKGNSMSLRRIAIAGLIGICSIGAALACGPFFPWQLLDDRKATLTESLDLGFASEVKRLMTGTPGNLPVVERAA